MKRHLATVIAGVVGLAPGTPHAKPARPSIHREAEQARRACAPWAKHVQAAEKAHGLQRHTLEALVWLESRCKPTARNRRTGAVGAAQFTAGGRRAVERVRRTKGEPLWRFSVDDALDVVVAIYAAAELLEHLADYCGSTVRAIGGYASGSCSKGARYARRVLRLAAALRWAAGMEVRS